MEGERPDSSIFVIAGNAQFQLEIREHKDAIFLLIHVHGPLNFTCKRDQTAKASGVGLFALNLLTPKGYCKGLPRITETKAFLGNPGPCRSPASVQFFVIQDTVLPRVGRHQGAQADFAEVNGIQPVLRH